jgi:Tfp pilus assembly protein PilN
VIKVNLASKKQAVVAQAASSAGKSSFSFDMKKMDLQTIRSKISFDLVKDPQTRKLLAIGAVALVVYFGLDSYENDLVQKQDDILTQVNAENVKLTAQLANTDGYQELKLEIDADEKVLRTKLDTIKDLINDRQVPPKLLLALSNDIPTETWLSEFTLSSKDIKLSGSSIGYTQITDFMKMLNESEYLTDVKLVNSKQDRDQTSGVNIATFELSAKRK